MNVSRLTIVFLLGFSSGLPLALITSTLQAWFADTNMSIFATGMLSLVGFPYVCRVLWGPLLDKYSLSQLGKRRSWIIAMQFGLLIGFNVMAWFTPDHSPIILASIAIMLAFFSATQDAAIDAHRLEYLPIKQHALGASCASLGYRLGLLTTGGLSLIIAHQFGWVITYRLASIYMLIGILSVFFSSEPDKSNDLNKNLINNNYGLSMFILPIQELLQRPGSISLILFIIFYKLGEAFTTTTSGIVMPFLIQGLGFSIDIVGYINKMLGIGSLLIGGIIAGLLLLRYSLYKALLIFGLLQAVANLLFMALAITGKNLILFALAVIVDNFVASMGSTALIALFMQIVNRNFTATQFSLLVAFATLPRILSGPFAALLQIYLGWVGLYQLSVLLALAFIPFLLMIKTQLTANYEKDYLLLDPVYNSLK